MLVCEQSNYTNSSVSCTYLVFFSSSTTMHYSKLLYKRIVRRDKCQWNVHMQCRLSVHDRKQYSVYRYACILNNKKYILSHERYIGKQRQKLCIVKINITESICRSCSHQTLLIVCYRNYETVKSDVKTTLLTTF